MNYFAPSLRGRNTSFRSFSWFSIVSFPAAVAPSNKIILSSASSAAMSIWKISSSFVLKGAKADNAICSATGTYLSVRNRKTSLWFRSQSIWFRMWRSLPEVRINMPCSSWSAQREAFNYLKTFWAKLKVVNRALRIACAASMVRWIKSPHVKCAKIVWAKMFGHAGARPTLAVVKKCKAAALMIRADEPRQKSKASNALGIRYTLDGVVQTTPIIPFTSTELTRSVDPAKSLLFDKSILP